MKILVVLNKNVKIIREENKGLSEKSIVKKFYSLNIECDVKSVEGKYLKETAENNLTNGYDAIVAAGGDGTISSVSSVLADGNIPLGVLPLGTLNHFAKDLNIPLDFDEAAETISLFRIKKIDLGEVNGRIFINNSSIGFYPKLVKHREIHTEKLGLNKWLSMGVALINVFRRFPSIDVKLHSEENSIRIKTPFVFIGNNDYKIDLFNLGTRTSLDKGKLCIYFPNTSGKMSIMKFAFLTLLNKIKQAEDFIIDSSENIILETRKKFLDVSADGEVIKLKTPLHYKIKPLCLKVIFLK
jgi:diacylglycerol kinase family enzyme